MLREQHAERPAARRRTPRAPARTRSKPAARAASPARGLAGRADSGELLRPHAHGAGRRPRPAPGAATARPCAGPRCIDRDLRARPRRRLQRQGESPAPARTRGPARAPATPSRTRPLRGSSCGGTRTSAPTSRRTRILIAPLPVGRGRRSGGPEAHTVTSAGIVPVERTAVADEQAGAALQARLVGEVDAPALLVELVAVRRAREGAGAVRAVRGTRPRSRGCAPRGGCGS